MTGASWESRMPPDSNLLSLLPPNPKSQVAVLDANLIVLLITAQVDLDLFSSLKRVRMFTQSDIPVLRWLLLQFGAVATNSYVLAEASNLGNGLTGFKRRLWFEQLERFTVETVEAHVPTQQLGSSLLIVPYGITDAALGSMPDNHVLITAEHRLSGHLVSNGRQVLNFNHFRSF
jgi:hypothetical protein